MPATTTGLRAGATHCRELYSESILPVRLAITSLTAAICIALFLTVRRRHQRRMALLQAELDKSLCHEDAATGVMQRRLRYMILAGFVWTSIWFWSFQTDEFATAISTDSSGPARPRMVFSFTTTDTSVREIQLTIDALVNQSGDGFDAIYMIVPRVYKGHETVIPDWLVAPTTERNASHYYGWKYTLAASPYHAKLRVVVLNEDFGPASKVLGTLLVEQDPDTIIVYGDDDRAYPHELSARALHYASKRVDLSEDALYCGRSLEIGINRVSFVGGAGGVVVRRRFYGKGFATTSAFAITELSKACFLGDDYYLSLVLSRNHVRRRVVYDSCWQFDMCKQTIPRGGLSGGESTHPGGANVEHYQACIRELGAENDLSLDAEFGQSFMFVFSRAWGVFRMGYNWVQGKAAVAC